MHQFGELLVSSKYLCVYIYIYTYSKGWKKLKIPNRFRNFKTYVSEIVEHNLQIPSKISLVFQISIKPNKSMKMTNPTTKQQRPGLQFLGFLFFGSQRFVAAGAGLEEAASKNSRHRRKTRPSKRWWISQWGATSRDMVIQWVIWVISNGNILVIYGIFEWYM